MSEYYIIDNWYEDPDAVRKQAIFSLKYHGEIGTEKVKGSGLAAYPGYRSRCPIKNLILNREKIEKSLNKKINPKKWVFLPTVSIEPEDSSLLEFNFNTNQLKVKNSDIIVCHDDTISNGSFQYCPEGSHTWVHSDKQNDYAAVIYLSPNPPPRCGTGLYKHKETGKTHEYLNEYFPLNEILDFNYWEEVTYVENVYNRCVIYNAKQFHTATGYFGTTPEDSRLTQVFFFHVLDE